jgi:hypothetical protein
MTTFLARKSDSFCAHVATPAALPTDPPTTGTAERIEISAPVGNRGANRADDTVKIQDALNRVPVDQGRAVPPLVPDGKCGRRRSRRSRCSS